MKYEIVCTTRKGNNSIDKLGYIQEGEDKNKAQDIADKEKINSMINKGNYFFFTRKNGTEAKVIAVEDSHVRTEPDDTEENNLLHLRACRVN
ncbi:MAG: DUF3892 domain-containing protein [Chloroflexi bacterium]|nr:DUF3892 domain-containing protein [Chloroflexota bacterium]